MNGALEGSELETFINPPNVNWYESEVAHLIQKCDRNDDKLISKVFDSTSGMMLDTGSKCQLTGS